MDKEQEILATLREIRDAQLEAAARQREALDILKANAERAASIGEESIALQRQAVERAKRIGAFALPAILICIGLLAYLLIRYNYILF